MRKTKKGLRFQKEDCSLIDIGTVYRVIVSFTDAENVWFTESVWKPDLLFEFPASKETSGKQRKFRHNIAEVKQTRMFSVMAADVSNKENLLLSTLQRILDRSFLISAIVEKKQPGTREEIAFLLRVSLMQSPKILSKRP